MTFDVGEILLTVVKNFTNLLPIRKIHTYEQGVRYSWGVDKDWIKNPGVYVYFPFFQSIETFDTRIDGIDLANLTVVTSDEIPLTISGNIIYKIGNARKYHTQLGGGLDGVLEKSARGFLSREARQFSYQEIINRKVIPQDKIPEAANQDLKVLASNGTYDNPVEVNQTAQEDLEEEEMDDPDMQIKGTSELENEVTEAIKKRTKNWGIKIFDFYITDVQKTRGFRLYGDLDTID